MTWSGRSGTNCEPADGICYEYHEFRCAGNRGGMCFLQEGYNGPHYDEIHPPGTCNCYVCSINREVSEPKYMVRDEMVIWENVYEEK